MATVSNPSGQASFEGPHNMIHILVGGDGHFNPPEYSAFDPIFYLHHATVDRYIAMWQAIYPDAWMEPTNATSGTWTIVPGQLIDGNTPLTPFTAPDKTTPYTTNSVRSVKDFGYSYPEVKDWLPRTPAELAANVTAAVNRLYNPDGSLGNFSRSMSIRGSAKRSSQREWTVKVGVPSNAIGEAFLVEIFVGDVGVAKMAVFAPPQAVIDAGANPVTNGHFTLTDALRGVDSENVEAVVASLKQNLEWTVVKIVSLQNSERGSIC